MSTSLRFPAKWFLAACVVAVSLGNSQQAAAQNYTNTTEWTESQLRIHHRIRSKDLLELRKKMNEVRDDLRTNRTSSRFTQTRDEYQEQLKQRLRKLEHQEQRLVRDLRAIRTALQQRTVTTTSTTRRTPFVPHLGAPVPSGPRPKYDPDTEYYLGLSRKMSEKETKELLGSFRKR